MSTFNNFTTTVFFSNFSTENQNALVKDGISAEYMLWNKTEIQMLQNTYQGTSLLLKNYIDQVLNRAINHYNGTLTTAYNRITTLEAEVTCLQKELTKLPRGNIAFKTKVLELPIFTDSENKIYLHDWLSQITLYCLASGIISDNQKIICALTHLRAPASTYMKSYYGKVQAGLSVGSWGDFAKNSKIFMDNEMTRREQRRN